MPDSAKGLTKSRPVDFVASNYLTISAIVTDASNEKHKVTQCDRQEGSLFPVFVKHIPYFTRHTRTNKRIEPSKYYECWNRKRVASTSVILRACYDE